MKLPTALFLVVAISTPVTAAEPDLDPANYQAADDWIGEVVVYATRTGSAPICSSVADLQKMEWAVNEDDKAAAADLLASGSCHALPDESHGVIMGASREAPMFRIKVSFDNGSECCTGLEAFIRLEDVVNISDRSDTMLATYDKMVGR